MINKQAINIYVKKKISKIDKNKYIYFFFIS